MITEIKYKGELLAILVEGSAAVEGTHPITLPLWPLQLLVMRRGEGHVFAKHTHLQVERETKSLQEAIVIVKGKLRITICDRAGNDAGSYELSSGQLLFMVNGGFKVEVIDNAIFYELKNGPHLNDKVLL